MDAARIVIADSQYLARAGFKHLFAKSKGVEVVGEAINADQLGRVISDVQPDVVIYDYHNSDKFTIEDIARMQKAHPGTRFLVVTSDDKKPNIFKVLEIGVNSILTKHCSRDEIVNAVHATVRGEKFFCNKVLDIILEKHVKPENEEENCAPTSLSTRETEIVGLIASGVSTREIADQLCLSTHTIYTHRKNIMKKLQINSVSEMVMYAVNSGIVKRQQI